MVIEINTAVVSGVIAAAGFMFASGRVVETIREHRYIRKEVFEAHHVALNQKLDAVAKGVDYIREKLDEHILQGVKK
jgi:hypothetical protein